MQTGQAALEAQVAEHVSAQRDEFDEYGLSRRREMGPMGFSDGHRIASLVMVAGSFSLI